MNDQFDFMREMKGLEFISFAKDVPIIWNNSQVHFEAEPTGEVYTIVRILPMQSKTSDVQFSEYIQEEINKMIDGPSDFDDERQMELYRDVLRERYHLPK